MLQRGRQFRPAIRKAPLQVQEGPSPGFILAGLGERGGFRDQRGAQFLHQFAQVVFKPFAASADEFMKRSSAFFSHFGFYARNCRGGLSHRSISKAYPNPENHRAMTLCRSCGRRDAESVHAWRWPPLSVRPCKIIGATMDIGGSEIKPDTAGFDGRAGDRVRRLLEQGAVVVLTGAGLSTSSGIPAYRDREGNWQGAQPVRQHDFLHLESARRRYAAPTRGRRAPSRAAATKSGTADSARRSPACRSDR